MTTLSIPEIIHGSWKEGFEIEWEIWNSDYDTVILSIYSSSIPVYIRDAAETYIMREMEARYPWVKVKFCT